MSLSLSPLQAGDLKVAPGEPKASPGTPRPVTPRARRTAGD